MFENLSGTYEHTQFAERNKYQCLSKKHRSVEAKKMRSEIVRRLKRDRNEKQANRQTNKTSN